VSEPQPLLSRATVPSVRRGLAPCRQRTTLLTSNLGRIETLQWRDSWELRLGGRLSSRIPGVPAVFGPVRLARWP
jgi:hypothetical protein